MEGLKGSYLEGETKVSKERKRKLTEWDKMLKNFRYGDALDSVLRKDVTPATGFALLEELIRRDGLPIALANRDDISLEPVLSFLVKHVTNPRYCSLATDVANQLIGKSNRFRNFCPFFTKLSSFLRLFLQKSTHRHSDSPLSSTLSSLDCDGRWTTNSNSIEN